MAERGCMLANVQILDHGLTKAMLSGRIRQRRSHGAVVGLFTHVSVVFAFVKRKRDVYVRASLGAKQLHAIVNHARFIRQSQMAQY